MIKRLQLFIFFGRKNLNLIYVDLILVLLYLCLFVFIFICCIFFFLILFKILFLLKLEFNFDYIIDCIINNIVVFLLKFNFFPDYISSFIKENKLPLSLVLPFDIVIQQYTSNINTIITSHKSLNINSNINPFEITKGIFCLTVGYNIYHLGATPIFRIKLACATVAATRAMNDFWIFCIQNNLEFNAAVELKGCEIFFETFSRHNYITYNEAMLIVVGSILMIYGTYKLCSVLYTYCYK